MKKQGLLLGVLVLTIIEIIGLIVGLIVIDKSDLIVVAFGAGILVFLAIKALVAKNAYNNSDKKNIGILLVICLVCTLAFIFGMLFRPILAAFFLSGLLQLVLIILASMRLERTPVKEFKKKNFKSEVDAKNWSLRT